MNAGFILFVMLNNLNVQKYFRIDAFQLQTLNIYDSI